MNLPDVTAGTEAVSSLPRIITVAGSVSSSPARGDMGDTSAGDDAFAGWRVGSEGGYYRALDD